MPLHDFDPLFAQYPAAIAAMPKDEFDSHEFILKLAQANQRLYVEALYAYRDPPRGVEDPFRAVHDQLSKQLTRLPQLVTRVGDRMSDDIFCHSNRCAVWVRRK